MTTKGISAGDMTNDLEEVRVQYRGVIYVLREIPMDEYDKTVEMATNTVPDPDIEGATMEKFDGSAHTRILLQKSLVEPSIGIDKLYKRGTRLVRGLQKQLQTLYWSDEPDELKVLSEGNNKLADKLDDGETTGEAQAAS